MTFTLELTGEERDLLFVALGELAMRRAEAAEGTGPVLTLLRKIRGQRTEGEPADEGDGRHAPRI